MRALILALFPAPQLDRLRGSIDVTYESWLDSRRLHSPEELAARLECESTEVLVVELDFVFDEVFDEAPSLRFVGVCRNATNQVDVDAATGHGVLVVNTPGRNARAVAEHALGLMLSLARRIPAAHAYVAGGRWANPMEPYMCMRGVELGGRTLGIVGLGAIGGTLAQLALALGMTVLAYDPYVRSGPDGVSLTDLDSLLAAADFVSIHAPETADTEELIDARRLSLMKPTAYLVNLSASGIVSQTALLDVLYKKKIAGAAFDVFETHPIAPSNPLLRLDNVVLTPHLGGATDETVERHSEMMAGDILRFVEGRRPVNLVNPEAWDARG